MSRAPQPALDRARFAQVADVILPPRGEMPAPSTVGISGPLLDRALAVLPPLNATVAETLAQPIDDASRFVAELKAREPRRFATLVLLVVATYCLAPEVRDILGYHGQEALTIDAFSLPGYLEDGTLDRVIERGAIYRDLA